MKFILATKHGRLTLLVSLVFSLLLATAIRAQDSMVHADGEDSFESGLAFHQPDVRETAANVTVLPAHDQLVITHNVLGPDEPVRIRAEDAVWLISARDSHAAPSDLSRLQCSRMENGNWENAQLDELVQSHSVDKSKVTLIYVHGDRTNLDWATSRGLQFYQTAFQTAKRPPVRLVIFAWRSERARARLVSDFKLKSQRAVTVGKTLRGVLSQFEDRNLVVAGHSLGAQVVLAALSKPALQTQTDGLGKYRVALFAHVLNSDFRQSSLAAYPHNPLVQQTDVFFSQDDRAVKLSQFVDRKKTKTRSSLRRLANASQSASNSILIRDVTHEVNKHSINAYGLSTLLNHRLAESLNATFQGRPSMPTDSEISDSIAQVETKSPEQGVLSHQLR